jgi:hypothetical protein
MTASPSDGRQRWTSGAPRGVRCFGLGVDGGRAPGDPAGQRPQPARGPDPSRWGAAGRRGGPSTGPGVASARGILGGQHRRRPACFRGRYLQTRPADRLELSPPGESPSTGSGQRGEYLAGLPKDRNLGTTGGLGRPFLVCIFSDAAKRVGLSPERVEQIVRQFRAEFPGDEMMVELHTVRAILSIERGEVTLDEILRQEVPK